MQHYTLHLSIGGVLVRRKCNAAHLNELVVDGSVHKQSLEIIGFTAVERRALYTADWVALEGADGRRLKELHAPPGSSVPSAFWAPDCLWRMAGQTPDFQRISWYENRLARQ
jgi:hypothetical protein